MFWLVFLVYNANLAYLGSSDTLPTLFLPASIVAHGDVYLERYGFRIEQTRAGHEPYSMLQARGHVVSMYPIAPAVLATPVYLVAALTAKWTGLESDRQAYLLLCKVLGKVTAAAFTALGVLLVCKTAARWSPAAAPVVAVALAFGSPAFSISSQGMWQHAPAMFFIALSIYWLTSPNSGRREFVCFAGLASGVALACRPQIFPLVLALGGFLVYARGRSGLLFFAFPLLALLTTAAYNLYLFGDVRGGYALYLAEDLARKGLREFRWNSNLHIRFLGLLVSPSRGLFVFSPYLLFIVPGLAAVWGRRRAVDERTLLLRALSLGVFGVLIVFMLYHCWWGGLGYGPRYMTEAYVPLVLFLVPAWDSIVRRALWRRLFFGAIAASCALFAIGAYGGPLEWYGARRVERRHEMLWSWRDGEIVNAFRNPSEVGNLVRHYRRLRNRGGIGVGLD